MRSLKYQTVQLNGVCGCHLKVAVCGLIILNHPQPLLEFYEVLNAWLSLQISQHVKVARIVLGKGNQHCV